VLKRTILHLHPFNFVGVILQYFVRTPTITVTRCIIGTASLGNPEVAGVRLNRKSPSFLLFISQSPITEFDHQLWRTFFGGKISLEIQFFTIESIHIEGRYTIQA
jgi:hypothetical protein